jgi:hypothetical protein
MRTRYWLKFLLVTAGAVCIADGLIILGYYLFFA